MPAEDRLDQAIERLSPATAEYARHVIREWVRNLPTAVALVEALEMKDLAREILHGVVRPKSTEMREARSLESMADRTIRALGIPPDAVFRGEDRFRKQYLEKHDDT